MSKPYSYHRAHRWVYKQAGKANHCEVNPRHKSTKFEWANISGEYKYDLSDWIQLCNSCHKRLDFTPARRQALNRTGMIDSKRRPVMRVNDGVVYDCVLMAAQQNGILPSALFNCLAGRTKTCGGMQWSYLSGSLPRF